MKLVFEPDHLALFAIIQDECKQNQVAYIVGGAVRDALLGRQLHDIDFVMGENPTKLGKRLSKRLNSGFFVLDDDRHTARVVYHDRNARFFPLDFVQYTGSSLAEDLRSRDFTINAMAIPIDNLTHVIDPLGGQTDLVRKTLRACSEHALVDDPVRVLRAVRLAVQYSLNYAPGLEVDLQTAAADLPKTSYERQRDEFFRILAGPDPAKGLQECRRFKIFDTLIPPLVDFETIPPSPPHQLPLFDHTLQTVAYLHSLIDQLRSSAHRSTDVDWWTDHVVSSLGRFSQEIDTYFTEEITPGRKKAALTYFGALLHDIGKPLTVKTGQDGRLHFDNHALVGADLTWEMAKRLRLSNAESGWLQNMVRNHMQLLELGNRASHLDRRAIYRFFKTTGDTGIAIAFHTLADTLATYGPSLTRPLWQKQVSAVESILSAWWTHKDAIVSPPALLDGHEIQRLFDLEPGRQIGDLLDQLVEEQASGTIHSKQEAEAFVRARLSKND